MLVSHRKQFIFTKTVKTASTSTEIFFEPFAMPEGEWEFTHQRDEYESPSGIIGLRGTRVQGESYKWLNHMSAKRIKILLPESVWNSYYKFCNIRNPYDKVVSYFFHKNRKNLVDLDKNDVIDSFRTWCAGENLVQDTNKYLIDGNVVVDKFIRYENLKEDISSICNLLNIEASIDDLKSLKTLKMSRSIKMKDLYDEATKSIVEKEYSFELEYFKYKFPSE